METQLQSTANTTAMSAYNKAWLALQRQPGKTDERGQEAAESKMTVDMMMEWGAASQTLN